MTSILCLAHYCDLHGPTPLMVTEGLPVPCSTCYEESDLQDRSLKNAPTSAPNPSAHAAAAAVGNALRKLSINGYHAPNPAFLDSSDPSRGAGRPSADLGAAPVSPTSAIETPPESPHRAPAQQQQRRDSSFRRTYDDNVTKRASPCENCAMTLPQKQLAQRDSGPNLERNPTLRSRVPWAKVYTPSDRSASPPPSQTSSASDTDGEGRPTRHHMRRATGSTTTRSSMSSTTRSLPSHTHYMHYTSTHEPLVANSFSIVRASCLRALSFETLPRMAQSGSNSGGVYPTAQAPQVTSHPNSQPFVTTHSAGAAATGGPIFFGDPRTGYTNAYIFRIPDVHARGHKRVYAFLALSTHPERLVMKTFGLIAAAFRELATWIQKMAEEEAEKAASASPVIGNGGYYGPGGGAPYPPSASQSQQHLDRERREGYGGPDRGSGSSFLTGGSGFTRRAGGGGGGVTLKSRGLAELVGMPDFFIRLHEKFVQLLLELGVKLSS
ncbi:vesicle coat protein [Plectosphaerella cucumerina]|uniref:Vesicle coat protein n=1 Tax=Plectosphaerella cucumerina TaxID=40658 RepID=A0A8K0X3D7_9PEZI|nr:vesicle coat protein [Plectosphaerella cucumerina]